MTGCKYTRPSVRWFRCLALALLVAGAASCMGRSESARFYMLRPVAPTPEAVAARVQDDTGCMVLGVGPVTLPGYVDREQMVARQGDNTVTVAEFDRWAEPLDKAFSRTLAANLEQQICARPAVSHPFPQGVLPDWQVSMQVFRHDCMPGRDCVVEAAWVVLNAHGDSKASGSSRLSQPLPGTSYEAMADVLSRLNAELAREVAGTVRRAVRDSR